MRCVFNDRVYLFVYLRNYVLRIFPAVGIFSRCYVGIVVVVGPISLRFSCGKNNYIVVFLTCVFFYLDLRVEYTT